MHHVCVHPVIISIKCPFPTICCDTVVVVKQGFKSNEAEGIQMRLYDCTTKRGRIDVIFYYTYHTAACFLHSKIRFPEI